MQVLVPMKNRNLWSVRSFETSLKVVAFWKGSSGSILIWLLFYRCNLGNRGKDFLSAKRLRKSLKIFLVRFFNHRWEGHFGVVVEFPRAFQGKFVIARKTREKGG